MAKTFKLHPIINLDGEPYKVPVYDSYGIPERENHPTLKGQDGKPLELVKMKEADLTDVLDILVRMFPKERMTMENITSATLLKKQILDSRKSKDSILTLEEGTHDWVKKMLVDEKVGPEIFRLMTKRIMDEVDGFERPPS